MFFFSLLKAIRDANFYTKTITGASDPERARLKVRGHDQNSPTACKQSEAGLRVQRPMSLPDGHDLQNSMMSDIMCD